jgi:ParB family transcriptional regulator, chromosome partitioning protein
MNDAGKRRGLGRGLEALLPSAPTAGPGRSATAAPAQHGGGPEAFYAAIEELHPNRTQPRTRFDEEALDELAASLKEIGMLEPILVRRRAQGGGFEIIAGERRWRAAQRAGLHQVPVFVRELSEGKAFEAALVENLQREDLNPLETARAYQRLIDEHGRTVESVAQLIGKDRSTVANGLRLLKLPDSVLDLIEERKLTEGHGRALLGAGQVSTMERLSREAVAKEWSVRETERRARAVAPAEKRPASAEKNPNTRDLEERLTRRLGTRVTLADRKGKGHVNISFSSYDELDRLIELLERS